MLVTARIGNVRLATTQRKKTIAIVSIAKCIGKTLKMDYLISRIKICSTMNDIPDFLLRKNWINGMPPASPLVGTYSMLNAYNNCPHAMYRRYIKKDLGPYVETPEIKWGNEVHEAMELRLKAGKPLPAGVRNPPAGQEGHNPEAGEWLKQPMQQWEPFAVPFDGKKPSAEPKLAVDRDAKACDYWNGAFFRGKVDVIVESGSSAYIFDWKTGNSKYENPFELATNAVLLQAARPHLKTISGSYVWLKENRMGQRYDLSDTGATWVEICARMGDIEDDKAASVFAKKKTGLCGYCSVRDCENWYDAKARRV